MNIAGTEYQLGENRSAQRDEVTSMMEDLMQRANSWSLDFGVATDANSNSHNL